MKRSDIQIRDPFILPVAAAGDYFLFGTTDKDAWSGPEAHDFTIDIRKARRVLGYRPKYDIYRIIDEALAVRL